MQLQANRAGSVVSLKESLLYISGYVCVFSKRIVYTYTVLVNALSCVFHVGCAFGVP